MKQWSKGLIEGDPHFRFGARAGPRFCPAETRCRLKFITANLGKTLRGEMAEAFAAWLKRPEKTGVG